MQYLHKKIIRHFIWINDRGVIVQVENSLKSLLAHAIEKKGSELHICPSSSPFIRVNGCLEKTDLAPINASDIKKIIESTYMLDTSIKRKIDIEQSVSYTFSINGFGRFRACTYQQRGTTAITIRILPFEVPTLDTLGYGEEFKNAVHEIMELRKGLFLIQGLPDSGKTSTLAGIIDCFNEYKSKHLTTIEDTIEYLHQHRNSIVTQKEIGTDVSDLKSALARSINHNADVIAVDEIKVNKDDLMFLIEASEEKLVLACMKKVIDGEYFKNILSDSNYIRFNKALGGTIVQKYENGVFSFDFYREEG